MGGFFFEDEVYPDPAELVGERMTPAESAEALRQAYDVLASLPEITRETAEEPVRALAEVLGLSAGQLFAVLRTAVTGKTVTPPLFESMAVIGRETVLRRIENAIEALEKMAL
jgi:glutamyl-tRNA synthetase